MFKSMLICLTKFTNCARGIVPANAKLERCFSAGYVISGFTLPGSKFVDTPKSLLKNGLQD